MSRLHPFDYAFGAVAEPWFSAIRDEAAGAGLTAADLLQFIRLESVRRCASEMAGNSEGVPDKFLGLLYAAYRFWADGKRTLLTGRAALERALDAEGLAPSLPRSACYVQLPEHWIWCRVGESAPHEPLDGLFISPHGSGDLTVLGVLGLRPDRGGFSEVSASASSRGYEEAVGRGNPSRWSPAMDGGAAAGFRSVNSNLELLLLASLALATAET